MISFDEAVQIVAQIAKPLPTERIALENADGRVLASPVIAGFAFPAQPTSAMDGYAVCERDLVGGPASLKLIGASYAGAGFTGTLTSGHCVRIFTGAPLPEGADRVVMQEDVQAADGIARFNAPLSPRRHVRKTGSDFMAGEMLLPAGAVLNPQRLVAAAAADQAFVEVVRKPQVVTIACGDELAAPGTALGQTGKVADSLSFAIAALVRHWHGTVLTQKRCGDDLTLLQHAAQDAVAQSDIVIVTGGASVGEKDFAKTMFEPLGLKFHFNKVAIRPGKPVWLGQVGTTFIMGLPGNPTSALTTARLFLAPLLAGLSGRAPQSAWQWEEKELAAPLDKGGERESFLKAQTQGAGLSPATDQDSAAQKALASTDYLIRQKPSTDPQAIGELVQAMPF